MGEGGGGGERKRKREQGRSHTHTPTHTHTTAKYTIVDSNNYNVQLAKSHAAQNTETDQTINKPCTMA